MASNDRSSEDHIARGDVSNSHLQASDCTNNRDCNLSTIRLQAGENPASRDSSEQQKKQLEVLKARCVQHSEQKLSQYSQNTAGVHLNPKDLSKTKSLWNCKADSNSHVEAVNYSLQQSADSVDATIECGTETRLSLCEIDSSSHIKVVISSLQQSPADVEASIECDTEAEESLFCWADSRSRFKVGKPSLRQSQADFHASVKCGTEAQASIVDIGTSLLEARCDEVKVRRILLAEDEANDVGCQNIVDSSISALIDACQRGDADAVKALIEKGVDVNTSEDAEGRTALHFCGHEDIAKLLIKAGADVNAKSQDRTTALHSASHRGSVDVAKLLLDCGADVNATDSCGVTPLHVASEYGYYDVVKLLLRHGGDVKAKTNRLDTPLHLACFYGRIQVVSELLKEGAEVFAQNLRGWTSLRSARVNGQVAVENLLIHTATKCAYLTCMKSTAKLRHFARAPAC